ncbi:MAG: acyl-CoA dehydrogenase family protein [Anaerolineae bacterium]
MDFSLNEDQRMYVKMFEDFCAKEVAPLAQETDHQEKPPLKQLEAASEQGFLGALFPEKYEGAELDMVSYALLMEHLGKACASTALTINVHAALVGSAVLRHGTEEQKEEFLPSMAAGEVIGAFALSESGAGSDAAAIRTTAERAGDRYILRGSKAWVTNAGIGHVLLVFARTGQEAGRGISAFLVDVDTPGVRVGYREKTMGLRGLVTNMVYFDGAEVPAERLLGEEGKGFAIALEALDLSRIGLSAICLGAAEAALENGTRFAVEHEQFGGPIAYKQAIQNMIADSRAEIEAMRHLVHYTAWLADEGDSRLRTQAAITKLTCSEYAMRVANRMLQVHGGYGYMKEYAIERIYRDLRAMEIAEGTSQILRFLIARDQFAPHGITLRP